MRLAYFACAWLLGLIFGRLFSPSWELIAASLLLLLAAYFRLFKGGKSRGFVLLAIIGLLASIRYMLSLPRLTSSDLAYYNDRGEVTLIGIVDGFPDVRPTYTNLRISAKSIENAGAKENIGGTLLLRQPNYPERRYGDLLEIRGNLETPPSYPDFDYRQFLAGQGVYSLMQAASVGLLDTDKGDFFLSLIHRLRQNGQVVINRLLSEPYAALLCGILLGIESQIPPELYEQFNATATSHIIVISGFNISLIAGALLFIGKKTAGMRYAPLLAIFGIWFYTILVGAGASVSRAAVMGSLWLLAILIGRPGATLNSLFASALLLTALDVHSLFDVSFQLSFTSTLGLILLAPVLERLLKVSYDALFHSQPLAFVSSLLREGLAITFAAQIFTTPLIIYYFGRFSIISPITNSLVVSVQPLIMFFGSAALIAGSLWLPLGQVISPWAWLPLVWMVKIVQWTASFPFASIGVGKLSPGWLVAIYVALGLGIWLLAIDEKRRLELWLQSKNHIHSIAIIGSLLAIVVLVWSVVFSLPDGRLHVAFLNVGQGDAILITTPDGKNVLVDGGPVETTLLVALGQRIPFWKRTLDLVINTHPQADHLAGLLGVISHYTLGQVILDDVPLAGGMAEEWYRRLKDQRVSATTVLKGSSISFSSGLNIRVLNPKGKFETAESVNDRSIVLLLEYGTVRFLLPGDISEEVEKSLLGSRELTAITVLKVPHHGSKNASSEAFLDRLGPSIAIISVGENRFGQPDEGVLRRLAERKILIYRTDLNGTVELITDGTRLWLKKER